MLVPSPRDVPTYDLKPEMSAFAVAEEAARRIELRKYPFILMNFANADMVGHTGKYEAAVRAMEALDRCLATVIGAAEKNGYDVLVTADHGNAEQMWDPTINGPHTAHTLNLVEVFVVGDTFAAGKTKMRTGGRLADIAPTVLDLMGLPKPAEMTGESLIAR